MMFQFYWPQYSISPLKAMVGLIVLTTLWQTAWAQQPDYSPQDLFPSWDDPQYQVAGVAGQNVGYEDKLFLQVLPNLIDIMIQFVAPIVFVMMVFAGLRFIYAQDNEEERNKAKSFFMYTIIGLMFVLLSYSMMRAVYFIFAT